MRGVNLLNNVLVSGGVIAQTTKAIANVQAILNVAGLELSDVSKLTVQLVDVNDLTDVNAAIYAALQAANAWPVSMRNCFLYLGCVFTRLIV
jgi:enamine deaminase RidA (YjgF/YER057c/UK114 family)